MAYLSHQCPHCQTPRSPLEGVAFRKRMNSEQEANAFFVCPICEKPVCAWLNLTKAVSGCTSPPMLLKWTNTVQSGGWKVEQVWPRPEPAKSPTDVPGHISRNFVQAEEAASRDHREAAGMAYRRALELTLKDKAPALKGTLEMRIDTLAKDGRLTADIAEWAHSIRDLGNEATHDETEPSPEDVADIGAFTRVVLEYLYTMPAKVARRASPPATPDVDAAGDEAST